MDNDDITTLVIFIGLCVFFIGFVTFAYLDNQHMYDLAKETRIKLGQDGFVVTKVEVNSPAIYVIYNTIQEFVDSARANNITEIYYNRFSFYFFNEDYSVGYKVYCGSNQNKFNDYLAS